MTLQKPLIMATLALCPLAAQASTIVFSNLQGNALLCGCSNDGGRPLGATNPGEVYTIGNAFATPAGMDFTLDRVRLAAGLVAGDVNSLTVSLYADHNHLPGTLLETFQINGQMGPFDGIHDHVPQFADSVVHPLLNTGTLYWLVVTTTDPQTSAAWNSNNTSDIGPVGGNINDHPFCCVRDDGRNAFEVLGTPLVSVPEPSAASMLMAGLAVVTLALIRRSRRTVEAVPPPLGELPGPEEASR